MVPWVVLAILEPIEIKKEVAVIVMHLQSTCETVSGLFSDTIHFLRLSQRNLPGIQGNDVNFNATSPSVIRDLSWPDGKRSDS